MQPTWTCTRMGTKQFSTLIIVTVVAALTALGWTLRKTHASETDATQALSPSAGTVARSDGAPVAIRMEVGPAADVARETVELDDLGAETPPEQEAVPEEVTSARSATDLWEVEYADHTLEQLEQERRDLLGRVSREKHAIGLEKLNRGEGVIMARGAKPDDEAFARTPGTMTVFRSGPDGTGEILWERVDLVEVDHPELFELDAKMRWVNQEWAQRRDASSGVPAGTLMPR